MAPTRGWITIRSIFFHQLASLRQPDLHPCVTSSDLKLHLQPLVWELLWVHQCCTCIIASSTCIMSKKNSTTQSPPSESIFILDGPARAIAHLAGHQHLLYPDHRQHLLGTTDRHHINIDMGIQDMSGILFKEAIFAVGVLPQHWPSSAFLFHRLCPLKCPDQQHQFQKMLGQQPRHHHCRYLSCHCLRHLCHCFCLHHHLHLD